MSEEQIQSWLLNTVGIVWTRVQWEPSVLLADSRGQGTALTLPWGLGPAGLCGLLFRSGSWAAWSLRMLIQYSLGYQPEKTNDWKKIRGETAWANSGTYSRCSLDTRFLFCQRKAAASVEKMWLLSVSRALLSSKQNQVRYWGHCCTRRVSDVSAVGLLLSLTWLSLIWGHKLTGPSVNQGGPIIMTALRSWTLWWFICMIRCNGITARYVQGKIHFLTSKQGSTVPWNSKVILLRTLPFVDFC